MQVQEFKAWFEGFCECINGAPTPEQFAKIKAKVAALGKGVYTGIRAVGVSPMPIDITRLPHIWTESSQRKNAAGELWEED